VDGGANRLVFQILLGGWNVLLLDANRVRVRSSDVNIQNVHADSVDVTLRDVSIARRSFDSIEGTLSGVRFTRFMMSTFSNGTSSPFSAR
jgi:hypothetical protein